MNSTTDSSGSFVYGIGISSGILLLVIVITLAAYFCTKNSTASNHVLPQRNLNMVNDTDPDRPAGGRHVAEDEVGLEGPTLAKKMLYSEATASGHEPGKDNNIIHSCCSICLADYKDSDVVRVLPECGHLFHLKCVGPWLRSHPTCPVCRTSPVPTPMATPLAEVVPLATRPGGDVYMYR